MDETHWSRDKGIDTVTSRPVSGTLFLDNCLGPTLGALVDLGTIGMLIKFRDLQDLNLQFGSTFFNFGNDENTWRYVITADRPGIGDSLVRIGYGTPVAFFDTPYWISEGVVALSSNEFFHNGVKLIDVPGDSVTLTEDYTIQLFGFWRPSHATPDMTPQVIVEGMAFYKNDALRDHITEVTQSMQDYFDGAT
jgi:hypothetical protein